jgi:hypothetical protein
MSPRLLEAFVVGLIAGGWVGFVVGVVFVVVKAARRRAKRPEAIVLHLYGRDVVVNPDALHRAEKARGN